jgi:Uma2 family endonuclease
MNLRLPDHLDLVNPPPGLKLPDHLDLPAEDGTFVKNFQEHPQSVLLTESIKPWLKVLYPDGQYTIGQDSGIYWRIVEPPERGCEAPDWFFVPHVPPLLNGRFRRSYVMWQEIIPPLLALEFVSGDGTEERDRTPFKGKFWVYEQAIRIPYYGIYEVEKRSLEMYKLATTHYERMVPTAAGLYPIPEMQIHIGLLDCVYNNVEAPWIRWWDQAQNLIPTAEDRADQAEELLAQRLQELAEERQKAEQERQKAEQAQAKADRLAAQLRRLGVDPEGEEN